MRNSGLFAIYTDYYDTMIKYDIRKLPNGLTAIAHRDHATRMVAVNMLYRVGSRNENPSRTGFAHLFEHLMFRGTRNVPDFDRPVQEACGENNAFTNSDYTDYYMTLPKDNVETALWLESDRMTGLDISPENLEAEKRVVIEEYSQRYLNQPYGDMWMRLRAMAYKVHPYRWATIGLEPAHIADASLEDVRAFYERYYTPSNAIIAVAGDIAGQEALDLCEKWFGGIEAPAFVPDTIPAEPPQTEARRERVEADVPAVSVTVAFRMYGDRLSRCHYECDLISDLLAGGTSSRLYLSLVKGKKLFSAANAYISNDVDPGLFVVTGHLHEGVSPEQGEAAIWEELRRMQTEPASDYELEKVKNKFEAGIIFGELNVMNKAMNLCYYEMLGDMSLLEGEIAIYRGLGAGDVMEAAGRIFTPENSSTLIYVPVGGKR